MNIKDFEVPDEDKGVFVKIMAFMAAADGKISLEEKQAIDDIIFAWKIDSNIIVEIYSIMENGADLATLLSQINNSKTPYLLVQELISLACIDGHYSECEKIAVRNISNLLRISQERLSSIEKWVLDGISWRAQGLELLAAEEA